MKEIPLTQGHTAVVDDADFERVIQHKWCAAVRNGGRMIYAASRIKVGGKPAVVLMHKFITGLDCRVDHADGDGRNNTRKNLRPCSQQQNTFNQGVKRNNKSGFKGVFTLRPDKWLASICISGKSRYIGLFDSPLLAAQAYDEAAKKYFGEFARTNRTMGLIPCS